jgi:hypothetical protein
MGIKDNDTLLDALKMAEGLITAHIDNNLLPSTKGCIAIRDHIAKVILQATGNEPLPLEQAIADAKERDRHHPHGAAITSMELAAKARRLITFCGETGCSVCDPDATGTPTTERSYSVMFRRTIRQFASMDIEAVDAEAAVRLGRTMTASGIELIWDSEDDATPVDWVHAELGQGEDGEADHAEWEEDK